MAPLIVEYVSFGTNMNRDHESSVGPRMKVARGLGSSRRTAGPARTLNFGVLRPKPHMKSTNWQDQIWRRRDFAHFTSWLGSVTHVGLQLPRFIGE